MLELHYFLFKKSIYFYHAFSPPPTLPRPHSPFPYPPNVMFFLCLSACLFVKTKHKTWKPKQSPQKSMGFVYISQLLLAMGPALECDWYAQWNPTNSHGVCFELATPPSRGPWSVVGIPNDASLEKTGFSFCQQLSTAQSFSPVCPLPSQWWDPDGFHLQSVCAATVSVTSRAYLSCCVWKTMFLWSCLLLPTLNVLYFCIVFPIDPCVLGWGW